MILQLFKSKRLWVAALTALASVLAHKGIIVPEGWSEQNAQLVADGMGFAALAATKWYDHRKGVTQ